MINYQKIEKDLFEHFNLLGFDVGQLFSEKKAISVRKLKKLENKIGFEFPSQLKEAFLNHSDGFYMFNPYHDDHEDWFGIHIYESKEIVKDYLDSVEWKKEMYGPQAEYWLPLRDHEGNGDTLHIDCSKPNHPIILVSVSDDPFVIDDCWEDFYKGWASNCFQHLLFWDYAYDPELKKVNWDSEKFKEPFKIIV